MLNILCDVCEQRRRMGRHLPSVACRACGGTGLIWVEETLPCEECRLLGEPESWLVYRDTVGWLTVWRCPLGHVRTKALGAVQTVKRFRASRKSPSSGRRVRTCRADQPPSIGAHGRGQQIPATTEDDELTTTSSNATFKRPRKRLPLSLPTIDRVRSTEVDQASHILLVDDDHTYTKMLRFLLEGDGYTVTTIESAERALESLAHTRYDLVLLAVVMPQMDGLPLCQHIWATRRVPILFLTVRSDISDKKLSLQAGADDYLAKPFEPQELLARIRALLRHSDQAEAKTHAPS